MSKLMALSNIKAAVLSRNNHFSLNDDLSIVNDHGLTWNVAGLFFISGDARKYESYLVKLILDQITKIEKES